MWCDDILNLNDILYNSTRGFAKKKNRPRVVFFISAILAGLTLLCNQAHIYIRKYDIIDAGASLLSFVQKPRTLRKAIFVALFLAQRK